MGPSSTPSVIPPLMSAGPVGAVGGPAPGAPTGEQTLSSIDRARLREQERRRREAVSKIVISPQNERSENK